MIPFRKRRARPEDKLQVAVARFLAVALPVDAWFTSIPTGNLSITQAQQMKDKGYMPGTPDMLIIYCGKPHWFELKATKRGPEGHQINVHFLLLKAGSPVKVVRSLDDVVAALKQWGFPLRAHTNALVMFRPKGATAK